MIENGDTVRGIRNLQRAIDFNQDYFEAHLQLGILYSEKSNQLAVDYFNNALNIDPGNTEVMYYLADYYQDSEQFDKAINKYNDILELDPEFFIALYNIGYIYLVYKKEFDLAIEYFTDAIEVREDYAEAYYNRGFAWELKQNNEKSRADYNKTLEYQPNYEKAIEGLNRIDEYSANR